jgi:hypothetical protein
MVVIMNNQPAFPTGIITDGKGKIIGGSNGMTLRDYFAASFMESGHIFKSISDGKTPELVAEQAYALADAMLKAREA